MLSSEQTLSLSVEHITPETVGCTGKASYSLLVNRTKHYRLSGSTLKLCFSQFWKPESLGSGWQHDCILVGQAMWLVDDHFLISSHDRKKQALFNLFSI